MSAESPPPPVAPFPDKIALPDIPALVVNAREAHMLTSDGEPKILPHEQARMVIHKKPVMVCHAPYTRAKLSQDEFFAFDVLELFAFVHPGKFCVPTPHGLAKALGMVAPESFDDTPFTLIKIAQALLGDLRMDPWSAKASPLEIAAVMGAQGQGWGWTPYIFAALGAQYEEALPVNAKKALGVWKNLPDWAEEAPEPPPSHHGVSLDEAQMRLEKLRGAEAEKREAQMEYAKIITNAFKPPAREDENPHVVLAEAGTGVGKTLGYLAPASVWAEKNRGTVWISTYTKNLQRQIDQELDRLYPNPDLKDAHVAVRKGRENYLCLLNLEDAVAAVPTARSYTQAVAAGIMARWAAASSDGDLTGAEFPGWLAGILGYQHSVGLADKRGECIYSACDHYHKCFVEHSVRKAERSRIVVANHALVMINAAISQPGENMPSRYIFDEGHHLFNAADSAYAAHLTAQETRDLRRWILGAEGGKRSRARGLKRRAEDLTEGMAEAEKALIGIVNSAAALTNDGWTRRFRDSAASGPCEEFLLQVYGQIQARTNGKDSPYSVETELRPVDPGVLQKAEALKIALTNIQKPMQQLAKIFRKKLADDSTKDGGAMDSDTRKRLDAVASSLERRGVMTLGAWIDMLDTLEPPSPFDAARDIVTQGEIQGEKFVDWMSIEKIDGRAVDVGLYRHHVDPMVPFGQSIKPHLHGMAVTSATMRDSNDDEDWASAQQRSGARYITHDPVMAGFSSPFDYAKRTKIFIINDVNKQDLGQVSGAYRALFEASGGGALGLFTAISRLRAVHGKIAEPLETAGLPLYAQHVDDIDPGTLVDMFRDDTHACLLGTDAIRDGVDVPGESLRLIVFDRVPWPRPNILHKARRVAYSQTHGNGRKYDEMITRLKLKQAFGRLIRRADDKGVFVMLDSMLPSRLHNAFPADAEIQKVGLKDTVAAIREFLK